MSSTNDFARELFAKIDSWTKTDKPIYVLTESTMVDDLELAVLKHLSKETANRIAAATSTICVTTPEKMAIKEMTGKDPAFSKPQLTSALKTQLVALAINQSKDRFRLFKKSAEQPGFAQNVRSVLESFQDNDWSVSDLEEIKDEASENETFANKMHDLTAIYAKYLELADTYATKNEMIASLINEVDSFGDFFFAYVGQRKVSNKKEKLLLEKLGAKAEEKLELFLPDVDDSANEASKFFKDMVLQHRKGKFAVDLTKAEALDIDLEAKWTAGKTTELLKNDESLRLRDIVIYLPPQNTDYAHAVDRAFRKTGLAYNLEQTTDLSALPLPQLLFALFEPKERRYEVSNISRMLKTKLILPDSSTNDNRSINGVLPKIEEFLNKAGIKTEAQWKATWECPLYDTKDLQSKNQDELSDFEKTMVQRNAYAEGLRKKVVKLFSDFDAMDDPVKDLYSVLKANGIIEIHAKQSQNNTRFIKSNGVSLEGICGRMSESRTRLTSLLDYLNRSNVLVSNEELAKHLKETFKEPYASGHDAQIDEIKIVSLDQRQFPHYKYAFVLGLDKDGLPGKMPEGKILTREDEEFFADYEGRTCPTIKERYKDIDNQLLDALTSASTGLFLSYSKNDNLGTPKTSSHYWESFETDRIETADLTAAFGIPCFDAASGIERIKKGADVSAVTLTKEQSNDWERLKKLIDFKNEPVNLTPELAKKLYVKKAADGANTLSPSFTAIDTYAENPYEFFLSYGLKLKEKEDYVLSSKNSGTYLHNLLENFTNDPTINKPDFDVVEAAGKVIENVDHNAFSRDRMDNENILSLLDATPQTRRFKARLQETFKRYLVALKKYQEENHSQVALAEVQFGENSDYEENNSCFTKEELEELGNLKGLEISFNLDGEEYRLNLSGKIDCISVVNNEEDLDTTCFQIVDYKTGNVKTHIANKLDVKLENGMKLQLVIYAMLFNENLASIKKLLKDRGFEIGKNAKLIACEYSGVNDKKSDHYRNKFKGIRAVGHPAHQKDNIFFDEAFCKDKEEWIRSAYQDILSGKLEISPYMLDQETGLDHSKFKSIINFDELFGNEYRTLDKENSEKTKE